MIFRSRRKMPIYTYKCENCGVQFDKHQKFSDSPLTICPECSKKALRKVYLPVGIVFKGSGFYTTDNRSPSGSGRAKTDPKPEKPESKSKTEKETTSTSETKPEKKSGD